MFNSLNKKLKKVLLINVFKGSLDSYSREEIHQIVEVLFNTQKEIYSEEYIHNLQHNIKQAFHFIYLQYLIQNPINNEIEFIQYLFPNIKFYPLSTDFEWGCYPQLKNNIIVGLKLIIPEIYNEKSKLIALHEVEHARELFPYLGKEYIEKTDDYELHAKQAEATYLLKVKKFKK